MVIHHPLDRYYCSLHPLKECYALAEVVLHQQLCVLDDACQDKMGYNISLNSACTAVKTTLLGFLMKENPFVPSGYPMKVISLLLGESLLTRTSCRNTYVPHPKTLK